MNTLNVRSFLVVIGFAVAAAGLIVGISDNPPGIALLYGGIICLVTAAVCRWQRPKSFLLLSLASLLGFVVFAILHNVLYGIGTLVDIAWIKSVLEFLHAGAFLIALLLCPAGVLVGLVGWIAVLIRTRRQTPAQEA